MQKYMCNVCGKLHSLFNDAALCHPDVVVKEVEDLPARAAEHRNEAEGEQTCPYCAGKGYLPTQVGFKITCSACQGTGHV